MLAAPSTRPRPGENAAGRMNRCCVSLASSSLRLNKRLARRNFLDERTKTIVLVADLPNNGLDNLAVRKANAAAEGIGQQFFREAASDAVWITLKQCLELTNIVKYFPRG